MNTIFSDLLLFLTQKKESSVVTDIIAQLEKRLRSSETDAMIEQYLSSQKPDEQSPSCSPDVQFRSGLLFLRMAVISLFGWLGRHPRLTQHYELELDENKLSDRSLMVLLELNEFLSALFEIQNKKLAFRKEITQAKITEIVDKINSGYKPKVLRKN